LAAVSAKELLWFATRSFGRDHPVKAGRRRVMGMLHRLFSVDELKDLELNHLEILKAAIANTIRTNDEIRAILQRRLQNVLTSLKQPPSPQPSTPP
jgi:hypothetical protein